VWWSRHQSRRAQAMSSGPENVRVACAAHLTASATRDPPSRTTTGPASTCPDVSTTLLAGSVPRARSLQLLIDVADDVVVAEAVERRLYVVVPELLHYRSQCSESTGRV
jgi:hypothetical protein